MSVLRDVLVSDLRIVFCGTAAGFASAKQRAYYAGPGNAFWRTLFEVGLTPRLLEPAQYHIVPQYGLGLTDLANIRAASLLVRQNDHRRLEHSAIVLLSPLQRFKRRVRNSIGWTG